MLSGADMSRPVARFFITHLFILALVLPAHAENHVITGKVVGVADGDTITVLTGHTQIKIRLHGIDTPEKGQAFGNRAKQFISDLVFGKMVTVRPTDTDRYGRTIAWVFVDGLNVNEEIVRAGFAWHYKRYSKDTNLAQAESAARANKRGLWSDPNAIPPWEFRQLQRLQ
jgi:micrococcal nuclease